MVDYGITRSAVRPAEKVVDEYSVWVNTNIREQVKQILIDLDCAELAE